MLEGSISLVSNNIMECGVGEVVALFASTELQDSCFEHLYYNESLFYDIIYSYLLFCYLYV